ncbi:hypothetical protein CA13_11670 [Planctomycetes bacterium CA13]|uniref:Uncharacterized protein n=1 Tax=Novipirellula herctigrandis TaxID=2527986 RepID=A0A5C5YXY0_9BACT|nr:hypothetical protein CA13_11670 [Planctomycetes bacterium CA13]
MNPDKNPYSAPTSIIPSPAIGDTSNHRGRSFIAFILAVTTFGTGIALCVLWNLGIIDLGPIGNFVIGVLLFCAMALLTAAIHYRNGLQGYALAFMAFVPCALVPTILYAMHLAGVLTLF